jgi:hypothetical protein
MIKWIDIASPALRRIHQAWVSFRGTRLMAHVNEYNRFVDHAPADLSLAVILPPDGASPMVKHAGDAVRGAYPNIWSGLRFEDIASTVGRAVIATPFHAVASSRQPDSRRGTWRSYGGETDYEQLLLPFDNDHLRVCVIHAVFDIQQRRRLSA